MEKMFEFGDETYNQAQFNEGVNKLGKLAGSFDATGIYPEKVKYVDMMNGYDGRPALLKAFEKATGLPLTKAPQSIAGLASGTTDKTLIPIYVDPVLVDQTRRLTPLIELIPRVTNYGITADFNKISARLSTGWRPEDSAPNDTTDTVGRSSTPIRFAYQYGRVTGPMLAASKPYLSQNYIDALNYEVRMKTITMRYMEEDTLINGDNTTARTSASTPATYGSASYAAGDEPSGMRKLITTNAVDLSGAALQISDMRTAVRRARTANDSATLGQGDPNLMVTDFATLDNIKGLLQDFNRYVNINYEIAWGMKTLEFEGLPIIGNKFMPTTAASRELLTLSTDTWQMRVLQDVTYEELARTNDSYRFMLKLYESPITTAEMFNTRTFGIA